MDGGRPTLDAELPPRARLLDPIIRTMIEASSLERRRRIAIRVAREALAFQPDSPPDLEKALAAFDTTGVIEPAMAENVGRIAADLDARYLDLYDDEKPSGRSDGWESAFRLARAAASVASALDVDPSVAAVEATYEAWFAMDEDPRLRDFVRSAT